MWGVTDDGVSFRVWDGHRAGLWLAGVGARESPWHRGPGRPVTSPAAVLRGKPTGGDPGLDDTSHLLSVPPATPLLWFPSNTRHLKLGHVFLSWIDCKYLETPSIPDQTPTANAFSVSALENSPEGRWEAESSRGHPPSARAHSGSHLPRPCLQAPLHLSTRPWAKRSQAVPHGPVAGRPPSSRPWGLGVRGPPQQRRSRM